MKECQNCKTKNADSAKHCNFCDALLPETTKEEKNEKVFIHNEKAEIQKAKKRMWIFAIIGVLIFSAISGVLAFIFANVKASKSEILYNVVDRAIKEEKTYSGIFQGSEKIKFTVNVAEDKIVFSFENGNYDTATLSKNGLVFKSGELTTEADEACEAHKLYVAYLLMCSIEKNPFSANTNVFKESVLSHVKNHMVKDFDDMFHEDSFLESICAVFATLNDEYNLKMYTNVTFPEDVENGETTFELKSYDFQNFVLSQFKTAFKSSSEYDRINQDLKDAKSNIKDDFKAKGRLATKDGNIESLFLDMKYKGKKYTLSLSVE